MVRPAEGGACPGPEGGGPLRVLQVLRGGSDCGGIESFVMDYYRDIDRTRVQFDLLVHFPEPGRYDDEIRALGGKIYYFTARKDKNLVRYLRQLWRFFGEHREYAVVHGHMPGLTAVCLAVAGLRGVPVRISHAHLTDHEPTLRGWVQGVMMRLARFPCNVRWACSRDAGRYMYGGKRSFQVIPNAIPVERFRFRAEVRRDIRGRLGLQGRFVVGHVGRLCLQKNQKFLLRVFREVLALRPDAALLLIGEGPLETEVEAEIARLGLGPSVLRLSFQTGVQDYLQAMDVFALPSLHEGLGTVLLEAQANGLPCVASSGVPAEADVGGVVRLPLDAPLASWAEAVSSAVRTDGAEAALRVRASGFDVETEAEELAQRYEALARTMSRRR